MGDTPLELPSVTLIRIDYIQFWYMDGWTNNRYTKNYQCSKTTDRVC